MADEKKKIDMRFGFQFERVIRLHDVILYILVFINQIYLWLVIYIVIYIYKQWTSQQLARNNIMHNVPFQYIDVVNIS